MVKTKKVMRVYEFAKDKGVENKDVLDVAERIGLDIKLSSSAGLTQEQVDTLEKELGAPKEKKPLKLAIAPAVKKSAKPEPEPVKTEEKPEHIVEKTRVKTAAEVRREAKIRKRKQRDEERRKKKELEKAEKKEKEKRKPPRKKSEKEPEPEAEEKEEEFTGAVIVRKAPPKKEKEAPPAPPEPVPVPGKGKKGKSSGRLKAVALDEDDQDIKPKAARKPMVSKAAPVPEDTVDLSKYGQKVERATRFRKHRYSTRRPRRKKRRGKLNAAAEALKMEKPTEIEIPPQISVRDLSHASGIKVQELILKLLNENLVCNINTIINQETIEYLCGLFDIKVTFKESRDVEKQFLEQFSSPDDDENLTPRKPIVTFLGHVDHGKTSLLDRIREAGVVKTESGGITQHVSAYIYNKDGKEITFIDTPGHAVFTEMRARGANVTDIVVLIVAADDGVMPQTREAYDHAVAAEVPIIVAINKIDIPGVDVNRVKGELSEMGLVPEDWGGSTQCAELSAITGEGVDNLLELIMLETEMIELKANNERHAEGIILETNLSDTEGITATMVVKNGTLHKGDVFLCGKTYGRVRHLTDTDRNSLQEAGPSTPIVITGFNDLPVMGDHFYGLDDIQEAKAIAEKRSKEDLAANIERSHVTMATLFDTISRNAVKELNILVKADAKGSVEAILSGIADIGTNEVSIRVVHSGVGGINESDVMLADASDAIIIGFHVSPESRVDILAEKKGVEIRRYHVIYEIFNEMEQALVGMLEPEQVEEIVGKVEVRKVFSVSALGKIAGCYVRSGVIRKSSNVRIIRNNIEIFDGKIESLRRVKDDVAEVKQDFECGLRVTDFNDIKEEDVLEVYEIREIKRDKLKSSAEQD